MKILMQQARFIATHTAMNMKQETNPNSTILDFEKFLLKQKTRIK